MKRRIKKRPPKPVWKFTCKGFEKMRPKTRQAIIEMVKRLVKAIQEDESSLN